MKKSIELKMSTIIKHIVLLLMMFAVITCLISCDGKPNDKLKINGEKYTISLGAVNYDADAGLVTIEVLADGKPLPNTTQHRSSSINVGGEQISSSMSSSQPVKIQINAKMQSTLISSSEDGIFTLAVDETPEKIAVFTGSTVGENVYFDVKTKGIISADEYYPPIQEQTHD